MEEQIDKIESDGLFDLYTHMKVNMKCSSLNCEIHDSDFTFYCFTCRRPVCEICKESFHSSHSKQIKKLINYSVENLEKIYGELEENLRSTRILVNPEDYRKELKNKIVNEFEEIEELILGLKKRKLQEIDMVFNEAKGSKTLNKLVKESKKQIVDYFNKYNDTYYSNEVKDEDNSIFLQTYDLYNMGMQAANHYNNIIKNIREYYDNYEKGTGFKYQGIKNEIEKSLEEERKNEILANNLSMFEISTSSDIGNSKLESNKIASKKDDKDNLNLNNFNFSNQEIFKKQVSYNFERLNDDMFKDLRERISKTSEFIEAFKKTTFESFKKHGSLVDIEKTVKMFDEKTNKRTNFIKGKAKLNFSPSQAKAYSTSGVIPSHGMTRSKNILAPAKRDSSKSTEKNENAQKNSADKSTNISKQNDQVVNNNSSPEKNTPQIKHFVGTPTKNKDGKNLGKDSKLECLKEAEDEEYSENVEDNQSYENENAAEDKDDDDDSNSHSFQKDEEDSVKLENGYGIEKKYSKAELKLARMFKPKKKKIKTPIKCNNNLKKEGSVIEEKVVESKYKVNNKLQELIKENQKLCTLIRKKEDVTLGIPLIRRYYSYMVLEFIRKNFFKLNSFGGHSQNILEDTNQHEEELIKDSIKLFEGTNEIQIYCREKRKLIKKSILMDKKHFGMTCFPSGSRTFYTKDRVYITGGKDCNQEYKLFMFYSIKENKLYRLSDMNHARSYHTMVYHENLKSILVFGGENNKTCEMFDFFLGTWAEIPELNLPRANISIFIDKIGTFAYAFCGIVGSIANGQNSDAIELLDLVDMNQGWAKVEYYNKANVDFKFSSTGVYPLTDDKILIYGAAESRKMKKCFVIFNLRTFDVTKVDKDLLENLRMNSFKNPEISRIFL